MDNNPARQMRMGTHQHFRLGSRKRHRDVRSHLHSGWNIHGNDFGARKVMIDGINEFAVGALHLAAKPGAE